MRWLDLVGAAGGEPCCVERVIVEEDVLGGFSSEEELCQQYCDMRAVCGHFVRHVCLDECIRPREKWPWLTDECLDLRRDMLVCFAGYSCGEYGGRGRAGDPCLDEFYNWEAANYECFGQYTETDGWQDPEGG